MNNRKNKKEFSCFGHYRNKPLAFNINRCANMNDCFRTALWTGENLQITLMSIPVKCDIGEEIHPDVDQFVRIQSGFGRVVFKDCNGNVDFCEDINANSAVVIPANTLHNIINTGRTPLKLYSIYAPPQHPYDTLHKTKKDAEEHCERH